MPPPPTNPIHLYRSILREITYLFDSKARTVLPTYIRHSFTSHREVTHCTRLTKYLKFGRQTHSLLIRANAGDRKACLKVLGVAYGRRGRPSRERLQPLITTELEDPLIPNELQTRVPKILPQLRALVKVQQGRVKQLTPVVPKTNIYGKPFPRRREANMRKKVYREAISKILPPVEEEELRRLERLVMGEDDMPVVKRRKRPKGEGEMDQGEVRRREVLSKVDGHYIRKQFRRRLYTEILAESPVLRYVEGGEDERGNQGEGKGGSNGDERERRAVNEESGKLGRWKAQLSPLGRGKQPVVGLEEEFDENEEDRTKNLHSGGRGAPGLVGMKRTEKLKGDI